MRRATRTLAVAATALLLAAVPPAFARQGADDPPNHDQNEDTTTSTPSPPPPPPAAAAASRSGSCGTRSSWSMRLDDSGSWLRVRLTVRTRGHSGDGRWRVIVLHERRIAQRATAPSRGGKLDFRTRVRDYAGSEVVAVRAVSPGGETCPAWVRL